MSFFLSLRLRWWAVRQFVHELALADCWDDVATAFMEEIVLTACTGHVNMSDLCCLYDEFPELYGPGRVGLKALTAMARTRLRNAAAMGLAEWGSFPAYCRAQDAHLAACAACQDRLYEDAHEEVRIKVEIDSIMRRAGPLSG